MDLCRARLAIGAGHGLAVGGLSVSRIFMSHSSLDSSEAVALNEWPAEQDPPLVHEIHLNLDPVSRETFRSRPTMILSRKNRDR
jgi:hypothetical protein